MCKHTLTHIHTHTLVHMLTSTRTHTHTHKHTLIHTFNTHTHTCNTHTHTNFCSAGNGPVKGWITESFSKREAATQEKRNTEYSAYNYKLSSTKQFTCITQRKCKQPVSSLLIHMRSLSAPSFDTNFSYFLELSLVLVDHPWLPL